MKEAFALVLIIGMIAMGVLMTYVGEYPRSEVTTLQTECELNLPRNQQCVMQFVPEKK